MLLIQSMECWEPSMLPLLHPSFKHFGQSPMSLTQGLACLFPLTPHCLFLSVLLKPGFLSSREQTLHITLHDFSLRVYRRYTLYLRVRSSTLSFPFLPFFLSIHRQNLVCSAAVEFLKVHWTSPVSPFPSYGKDCNERQLLRYKTNTSPEQ